MVRKRVGAAVSLLGISGQLGRILTRNPKGRNEQRVIWAVRRAGKMCLPRGDCAWDVSAMEWKPGFLARAGRGSRVRVGGQRGVRVHTAWGDHDDDAGHESLSFCGKGQSVYLWAVMTLLQSFNSAIEA